MKTHARVITVMVGLLGPLLIPRFVGAAYFIPRYDYTSGSDNYQGHTVSFHTGKAIQVGYLAGILDIRPFMDQYQSNGMPGSYRTYGARIGFEGARADIGLIADFSPKAVNYQRRSYGMDAWVHSPPPFLIEDWEEEKSSAKNLLSDDGRRHRPTLYENSYLSYSFGGGLTVIDHQDQYQTLYDDGTSDPLSLTLRQTDLFIGGAIDVKDSVLSVDLTKSNYNQDINGLFERSLESSFGGLSGLTAGLPDISLTTRLDLQLASWVTPYVSYRLTRPKLDLPETEAVTVGAALAVGFLVYEMSFQKIAQVDTPSRTYVTFGGNLRFGH